MLNERSLNTLGEIRENGTDFGASMPEVTPESVDQEAIQTISERALGDTQIGVSIENASYSMAEKMGMNSAITLQTPPPSAGDGLGALLGPVNEVTTDIHARLQTQQPQPLAQQFDGQATMQPTAPQPQQPGLFS